MKSLHFIRKTFVYRGLSSSGAMCLLSIIRYHKGVVDTSDIIPSCRLAEGKIFMSDLVNVAKTLGFRTQTGTLTLLNLKKFPYPVILHVRNDLGIYDFVVCYGFHAGFFRIGIPNWGLMEFRDIEMEELWESRMLLYLEPTVDFKRKKLL